MKPIELELLIAAPADEVWAELERLEDHVTWMADAVAIDFVSEQHRGLGTRFTCATKVGPLRTTDEMTITEWSEGSAMAVAHEGAVSGEGRFSLHAASGGTLLRWNEQLRFPLFMGGRLGALAARPVFRWIWRRNLVRLKDRIELKGR